MHRVLGVGNFVGASLCALFLGSTFAVGDVELFVSPSGHDSAVGSAAEPLATLSGAQQRLRELRAAGEATGDAHVWIADGIYQLDEELEFTEEDNASAGAATVYEALPGERVIIRGGTTIPNNAWKKTNDPRLPEAARSHVRIVDLKAFEIAHIEHHPRRARHSAMHPVPLELFSGDKRLPVAGWPNNDWAHVGESLRDSPTWNVTGLRPVDLPVGARAHGFWQHDWQDSCEPVSIQPTSTGSIANHSITIDAGRRPEQGFAPFQHQPAHSIRPGARYRIENLLTELDAPGEWYHDPETHQLFAWLPEEASADELFVSTLETPISFYDCEKVTLRGLIIEGALACCIEIAGGKDVCVEYCQLRHAGNLGVHIYHGQQHCVAHCDITSTGAGAIRVDGGHRETLLSCEHVIEHNRLHDYAQLQLAYRPAVNVYGVGVVVRHNAIFDAPHSAIVLHGNEHLIEYNEIHHVCQQTDDVGAIYLAHNPTYRGNLIRHNHIHDLGGFSHTGVIGIYLDDFASGTQVTHNVLERAGRGVAIGGGRDNVVENNVFLDCLAAVQIDCRGTTWAKDFVKGNRSRFDQYLAQIEEYRDIYAVRYPELATLMNDSPELAKGNRIARNLFDGPIGIDLHDGLNEQLVEVKSNFDHARSQVVINGRQFEPRSGSEAETAGFERIDLVGAETVKGIRFTEN